MQVARKYFLYAKDGTAYAVSYGDYLVLNGKRVHPTNRGGYGRVHINGKLVLLHRYVMKAKKGEYVDHEKGDIFDCRRSKLRKCSNQQNCSNRDKSKNNTTGFKGVTRKGSGFQARIKVNYRTHGLGRFTTAETAARVYDKHALIYFGEFARLNFEKDRAKAHLFNPSASERAIRSPTGYRGVSIVRGKSFVASLRLNGKAIHGGTFRTPLDAAKAYDDLARKHLREKAITNFN